MDARQPQRPIECPVENWLGFLGHRWNALVPWHLKDSAKRHGELAALLPGVAPKFLAERLLGLESRGLVVRSPILTLPRGVLYDLSSAGVALVHILDQLEMWSHKFQDA